MEQPQQHHHHEKGPVDHVLKTPTWLLAVRCLQVLLAFVILVLSGYLMHDAYLDELGFTLAMGLITCIVVPYIIVSEKISSMHKAYNVIAVLVIEALMVILWLAAFAAMAAKRASFIYPVNVNGCYDDGSSINSKTCFKKRGIILFERGAAIMAAIAGLGAWLWLLFIATFVWTTVMYFRGRKQGRFAINTTSNSDKPQQHQPIPMVQQHPQQQQQYPVQSQGQYVQSPQGQYMQSPQGQYPQQGQYQQQPYQQTQSPYQQNSAYPPPDQQAYGQYPQQPQPMQPQVTGQSYQHTPQGSELASTEAQPTGQNYQHMSHGSELAATETRAPLQHGSPPPAGSPPPQQNYQFPQEGQGHQQPYPPQHPTA